jgi:enoyl-[acyl-carrier-protein] reductase (NADH)
MDLDRLRLKGLIVGIANERSIAWGCAKAFRALGAKLAITYVNDKTRSYVEPLVRAFLEIGPGLQLARASSSIGAARSTARVLFVLLAQML